MIPKIKKLLQVFHTLKYLKFEQFFYRVYYQFKKPNISLVPQSIVLSTWSWTGPAIYNQSMFDDDVVCYLSLTGTIDSADNWNDPNKEKLWLYNLHYFDDLNSIDFDLRNSIHHNFIARWIDENLACDGNGWEAYPLSLRIVNWVKWFSKKESVEQKYLNSIIQQASALSQQLEYHILGNHLFANAKALTFVGCYIEGKQAEKYLDLGLKLLDREIPEQFLEDGAHFELSPMYHEILLWDLLELIDLAKTSNNVKLLERLPYWSTVANKAISWLKSMIHPDGEISFFNDAAIGIAVKPQQVFDYALSLNIDVSVELPFLITNKESGYSCVSLPLYKLIIDHANVGPDYLPGHAHADTLSFELSVGNERIFVNSGTSLYGVSEERLRQRKTAAHNTVVVDDEDSSEVWSGFRVARRAYSTLVNIIESKEGICIEAEHDGYKRLAGKVIHSRRFFAKNNIIEIEDTLDGIYNSASAFFHLHPNVTVENISEFSVELTTETGEKLIVETSNRVVILESTYHPEFGVSVDNKLLKVSMVGNQLITTITIKEN